MIVLWTDGSANPNPGPGGFAVIRDGEPVVLGAEKNSSNIRMEGTAILSAIKYAGEEGCEIWTDSQFWVNVLTKWAPDWEANDWQRKNNRRKPIENLELVKQVYELYKEGKTKLEWTRGHVGTEMNEVADEWADKARKADIPEGFEEFNAGGGKIWLKKKISERII